MDLIFIRDGSFNINGLLSLIFVIVCLFFFGFLVKRYIQRRIPFLTIMALLGLITLSALFCLEEALVVLVGITVVFSIVCFTVNLAEVRSQVANQHKSMKIAKSATNGRHEVDHIYDKDLFYKTINESVAYLSKHKIGAILTFERKDNLDKVIKNGSVLNAPVTYELLITIFYPGTRLHDGAVVIRDDSIVAASVYYSPTTKPLVGKYGSRHRAAIGISEICDAVTVVVSEETGKISIALDGELESYSVDNFYTAFVNIMTDAMKETTKVEIK